MSDPFIIPKNSREELRVSVDEFRGRQIVNLRVWFRSEDGEMRPGRQGAAVKLELLPSLWAAFDQLMFRPLQTYLFLIL